MTITAAEFSASEARHRGGLRQVPGMDGLRAIAVLAVIAYHLDPHWLPGGYLGVDVFFVISGYLITALLLSEHRWASGIDLRRFWGRRALRLFPALGAVLLATVVLAACFGRDALDSLKGDLPASVFYVMNWKLVLGHASYIASFGRPPLLQHLWSLSVEEQFYLIWPLVLLWLLRRRTRGQIALICLAAAGVSAGLMALLFDPSDPSAVYFATETHAFGLLTGCALAAAVPPWRMTASVPETARRVLDRAGLVALLGVASGFVVFGFGSAVTYRGGMLLVDLATAVVVATIAHPAARLGTALSQPALRWIGLRSYSLYLWHWPIFELLRPGKDLSWPSAVVDLIRLALTFAAAAATYRWVEQPWRAGHAYPAVKHWLSNRQPVPRVAAMAAPGVLLAVLLATAPPPDEPPDLIAGSTPAARSLPVPPLPLTEPGSYDPTVVPRRSTERPLTAGLVSTTTPTTRAPAPTTTVPAGPVPPAYEPILAIGDSVMLAAAPQLQELFGPAITVDAAVGRQVGTGLARIDAYRQSGALQQYKTVVVDLGTNGRFTAPQFQQIAAALAGVPHVVFFDVHAARSWATPDNQVIAQGVAAHSGQMKMVDWNSAASGPGLLYPDGVHPDPAGSAVYARLLQQALAGQ